MLARAAARCLRPQTSKLLHRRAHLSDKAAIEIKQIELAGKREELAAAAAAKKEEHAFELEKLKLISASNKGLFEKLGLRSETAQILNFVVPVTVSSAAAILYFASLKTEIGEKITPLQKTEQFVHSLISGGHFPKEKAETAMIASPVTEAK